MVDDSTLFRKVVRDVLQELADVEVVGVAANGKIAIDKVDQLKPDLLTLDLEMPELDGIGVLQELRARPSAPAAIMLSSLTERGAKKTTEALELGAFDFILKPSGNNLASNTAELGKSLGPKIAALKANLRSASTLAGRTATKTSEPRDVFPKAIEQPAKVCLVGVSTGGPAALGKLLPLLSADFPVPVIVVQHMPAVFTKTLADSLNAVCQLDVQEIQDGMQIRRGHIYIAPGGHQTRVVHDVPFESFQVTDDPPENHCLPSIDYLFRHAARVYGGRSTAVILTGMGNDGTEGCRILKELGSRIIAEHESSCVVYGMPRSVVEAGLANVVKPLSELAETIEESVRGHALCK